MLQFKIKILSGMKTEPFDHQRFDVINTAMLFPIQLCASCFVTDFLPYFGFNSVAGANKTTHGLSYFLAFKCALDFRNAD